MSDICNPIPDAPPVNSTDPAQSPPPARERVWLPIVVLLAFWFVVQSMHFGTFSGGERFVGRILAELAVLLFFVIWWLVRRTIALVDRLLVVGGTMLLFAAATAAADPSIDAISMSIAGVPWMLTLGTAWYVLTRGKGSRTRASGILAIAAIVFGTLDLLRWEGVNGRQISAYSWRWTPTAEETFLATRARSDDADATNDSRSRPVVLRPGDWPGFRGADREGVVHGVALGAWDQHPPEVAWKQKCGPAWSSFAVVDGRLYTQEQRGPDETTVCYDAATGAEVWVHAHTGRFDEALAGPGPRGTPTFADGRIYAYGANGRLVCLAADSGDEHWSHAVLTEADGKPPQWGLSVSPLVADGLVIVFAGGSEGRCLLAFDAVTGEQRWKSPAGSETYASPQVVTLAGVRQILIQDNGGVHGFDFDGGRLLWEHANDSKLFIPMLQPHVVGDTGLLVAWGDGIARFDVRREGDGWTVTEQWRSNRLKPGFNDFFVHDGCIFGLDDGILACLSLEDGQRLWKRGRYGAGQLLLLPDADELLVVTERGEVAVVAASAEGYRELALQPVIEGKTWNHAAFAHGRLYLRNAEEMACLKCGDGAAARSAGLP